MASENNRLAVEYRPRRWPAAVPAASNSYVRPPIRLNYFAALPPLSDHPLLELRRPANKDACFAVSALSPQVPSRYTSGQDSVGTCLLDRFLYSQGYEGAQIEIVAQALESNVPPRAAEANIIPPSGLPPPPTPSSRAPNLWAYAETPLTPRNPRNVWAFMTQQQWPANESAGAHPRVHSIDEDHESKDSSQIRSGTSETAGPGFRQVAKGMPPLPLKERAIISQPTPIIPDSETPISDSPSELCESTSPHSKRPSPCPIDIQLCRDQAAARLEGLSSPPPSGGTSGSITPKARPVSPGRGVLLSPLNTQVDTHEKHVRIEVVISPILSPAFSDPKSPISLGRTTRSSTPPVWSPLTPIAMAFDYPIIINPNTPPLPALAWSDDNIRNTVIDEHPQEEPAWELAVPHGMDFAESLSAGQSKPSPLLHEGTSVFSPFDTPISAGLQTSAHPAPERGVEISSIFPSRVRARSLSPQRSAHPDSSGFTWEHADIYNRHATDDNLDLKSPLVAPQQMTESKRFSPKGYVPKDHRQINPRDAILGTYFQRNQIS